MLSSSSLKLFLAEFDNLADLSLVLGMDKDNGGPAFPTHGSMGEVATEGMSLRDYFMTHYLVARARKNSYLLSDVELATKAFEAMLAERKK